MRNFVLSNTRFTFKLSIFVAEYLLYTQDMGKNTGCPISTNLP